ncbi:MAG: AAA family ATPase [Hyphomonadaceae bacterium]
MSNENALFEDDFSDEFEDDFADDLADEVSDEIAEPAPDNFDEIDHVTDVPEPANADTIDVASLHDGGDRPIPAISIIAFVERSETRQLIEGAASDRRMSRAMVDIQEGGLDAATAYLASNATPNLLIVESVAPAGEIIRQVDQLAEQCDSGVQVMVIGAMNDIALYRQLVSRGVSEYLVPPIAPVSLIRSIGALFSDPDKPFIGKSIAVVGAKGGVGASTVAHNLAWSITENVRVNAALVDLDLSFGTTALDFNQDGAQSVADALLAPERADDSVIERLLTKATDRLSLFTAPASVGQVLDIPPEAYTTVIDGVRRAVPYVVLDLPHVWNQWLANTLVSADEVILVCQPDLASLRNGKNILDQLKLDRPNDALPRLVLNMTGVPKRPEIPVKDFASAIGIEPEIVLPFDPQLFGTAANNGQMISETDAHAKSSLALDYLASQLTGRSVEQPEKSFLQKLFKKS